MNFFDILVLVIVLLGAIQGYRKGLISGLISLGGSILGLVLAARNSQTLLAWLDQNTSFRGWLEAVIYKRMLPSVEAKAGLVQEQTLENFLSMFPKEFKSILGDAYLADLQKHTDSILNSIAQNFSQTMTENALKIISFVLIYFGVVIVIELISVTLLAPLGLFSGTINGGGGFIVGGIVSFLGLAIFVGLFSPLLTLASPGEAIGVLESSKTYPYLKDTFAYMGELLRLNFVQGLDLPLDLENINLPIELKDIVPDSNSLQI